MLQQMSELLNQHPNIQKHFSEGLHIIQKNIRLWAGFSSACITFSLSKKVEDPVEASPENNSKLAPIIATIQACL